MAGYPATMEPSLGKQTAGPSCQRHHGMASNATTGAGGHQKQKCIHGIALGTMLLGALVEWSMVAGNMLLPTVGSLEFGDADACLEEISV